jgi:acyl-CoA synthetase (AMP-forming)/AMP-acid ligase II
MAAAIVDSGDRPIPAGSNDVGEGAYRSPALTCGYYRNPEATREAMRGGWFHGGDAFQWGESNQRMLVDRFKDIVKSGGENVSSIRVESVLMQHPAVARAGVIGLSHPRWGEAVTAFVVLRDGAVATEDALVAFARSRLAGFEVPKKVVFVGSLPETVGGKLQKHVLRAEHRALYDDEPGAA